MSDQARTEAGDLARRAQAMSQLPDARSTRPTTVMEEDLQGVARTYIVQTILRAEDGFSIFLQIASPGGTIQFVLPPAVSRAIYGQRDRLTRRPKSAAVRERERLAAAKRLLARAKADRAAARASRNGGSK